MRTGEIINITSKSILLQEINSLYSIIEILLQNLKAHYGNFSTQKYFKHYLLSFSWSYGKSSHLLHMIVQSNVENVSKLHTKNIEFRNKQIFAAALTIVLVEWFRVHLVSGRNRLKAHQTKFFLLFLPYFIISLKKMVQINLLQLSNLFFGLFQIYPKIRCRVYYF